MCFERSTAREALTYFWNCQTLGVSPAEPGAYQGLVRQIDVDGTITTVAGTGSLGAQDGVPVSDVQFLGLQDLAVDNQGRLLIADFNRVFRVGSDGLLESMAGGGTSDPGEGLPASDVFFQQISGIDVDPTGTLYLTDAENDRAYTVDPTTSVLAVAMSENRPFDFSQDVVFDSSTNDLYWLWGTILDRLGSNGSFEANIELIPSQDIHDLIVDPLGGLLATTLNQSQLFSIQNGVSMPLAGGGLEYPGDGQLGPNVFITSHPDIAADANGNVFIGDTGGIRRLDRQTGTVSSLTADLNPDGSAADAVRIVNPGDIFGDSQGNLYVVQGVHSGGNVARIDPSGAISAFTGLDRALYDRR